MHVFYSGKLIPKHIKLRYHAHPFTNLGEVIVNIQPKCFCNAFVFKDEATNDVNQSRFACSIVTHYPKQLAFLNIE